MARQAAKGKKMNRVDGLRALDRGFPTRPKGGPIPRPGQRPPLVNDGGMYPGAGGGQPPQRGGPQRGGPNYPIGGAGGQGPQDANPFAMHPFLPASIHPVVPANMSESGSAPGTPNIAAMVMRSFQPSVMSQTPLISSGAGVQPNSQFNFGGPQTPSGTRGMQGGGY